MPIFDLKCDKCDHLQVDVWLKPDELPTGDKSETDCPNCKEGKMYRKMAAPNYHWKAGNYGGDASQVNRIEFISKDVEEIDHKASQREGRIMLKDSK